MNYIDVDNLTMQTKYREWEQALGVSSDAPKYHWESYENFMARKGKEG